MVLDQFEMLRRIEPEHQVSQGDLLLAISHLYEAVKLLNECEQTMQEGTYTFEFPMKLADSWYEVNKCRVYTESISFIEEILIPVMGLINDAKSMFDSLIVWRIGMTKHGFINILSSIRDAVFGIRPCLEELESWIADPMGGGALPESEEWVLAEAR